MMSVYSLILDTDLDFKQDVNSCIITLFEVQAGLWPGCKV